MPGRFGKHPGVISALSYRNLRREVSDQVNHQIRRARRVAFEGAIRSQARREVPVEDHSCPEVRRRDERLIRIARPERQVTIRNFIDRRRVANHGLRRRRNVRASARRRLRVARAARHRHSRRVAPGHPRARVQQARRPSQRVEEQALAVRIIQLRRVIARHIHHQIRR